MKARDCLKEKLSGSQVGREALSHLGTLSPTPWDLALSRQNVAGRAACAAPSFRPLGRRSGRIPALPYPPPR